MTYTPTEAVANSIVMCFMSTFEFDNVPTEASKIVKRIVDRFYWQDEKACNPQCAEYLDANDKEKESPETP